MGAALWAASALSLFFVARIVPAGRPSGVFGDLIAALLGALLFGLAATALDFGGWRDSDWRAVVFVVLGAAALIGAQRAVRLARI
jgi:uncharacterized membrane protein YeaQ/YmgE (transglycosylase-associated protein family)